MLRISVNCSTVGFVVLLSLIASNVAGRTKSEQSLSEYAFSAFIPLDAFVAEVTVAAIMLVAYCVGNLSE